MSDAEAWVWCVGFVSLAAVLITLLVNITMAKINKRTY